MAPSRTLAVLLVCAVALAASAPVMAEEKDQCQTCKELVNATREELRTHAGDAKAFLLDQCEKSPALLKATCFQVAKSAGDTIKKLLDQAYETITEETMCAALCKDDAPDADDAAAAVRDAVQGAMDQVSGAVHQVRDAVSSLLGRFAASAPAGPLDVACDTCKSLVAKAKDWLVAHQADLREFMYKQCEQMKDVDVDKCKETADQVAEQAEAAEKAIIEGLDEDAACALFCPSSRSSSAAAFAQPALFGQQEADGAARKYLAA